MKGKIATFLFIFLVTVITGCSEEVDYVQKGNKYIAVGQQQKGADIFSEHNKEDILKMVLRTYDTTCYELTDVASLEYVQEILFNSVYTEIENPWLEGGSFLEIYANDQTYELTINADVISYDNKTYQILDKALYDQLVKIFKECSTKTE